MRRAFPRAVQGLATTCPAAGSVRAVRPGARACTTPPVVAGVRVARAAGVVAVRDDPAARVDATAMVVAAEGGAGRLGRRACSTRS
ncbi:MAG TPA: hypothetical protein VFZ37_18555 [Jiangellaceae bacterium]